MKKILHGALFLWAAGGIASLASGQSSMSGYFNAIHQSYNIMPPAMRQAMKDAADQVRVTNPTSNEGHAGAGERAAASPSVVTEETFTRSSFKPAVEERSRMIDALVASLPESFNRPKQRALIDSVGLTVEQSIVGDRYNLAKITHLLTTVSLRFATSQTVPPERSQEILRSIACAYSTDGAIQRLDDRKRSQVYYLLEATVALELGWALSHDKAEQQAGRALAQSILRNFGVQL